MAAVTLVEKPESPELKEFYDRIEGASQGMGVLNVFKTMVVRLYAWGRFSRHRDRRIHFE